MDEIEYEALFSATRIVLEELGGEDSIASICRREGIAGSLYYSEQHSFIN